MLPTVAEEVYPDGKTIIEEDTSGNQVYVIRSGAVEISKTIRGTKCIIAEIGPGDVFGELSFLEGDRRTCTARAVGETCVEIIDSTYLDGEFAKLSPELTAIFEALVKRFQQAIDRAMEFSSRQEPRARETLSLKYADKKAFFDARTENVGNSGLFIKTETPLQKGEQFLLELQLPGIADPLKVKGEVVWAKKKEGETHQPNGMGIKFVQISKEDAQTLKEYINQ
ncbi:MAG: TIGR02266 family protein [Deltaproteobacteria bacterium]|nr:TIGR02266 family protein [Deltaproteobacteria bacterium]